MNTKTNKNISRTVDGVVYVGRSVFDDLGFTPEETVQLISDAQKEITQRNALKLAAIEAIKAEIHLRDMNVTAAAQFLEISRPRLSNITNAKLEKFSIDSAIDLLTKFGKSVQFSIVDTVDVATSVIKTRGQAKSKRKQSAVSAA